MGKFNPENPKTTLELSKACKQKALALATASNLSVNQLIEKLVMEAKIDGDAPTIREELSRLQQQVGRLNQQMSEIEKPASSKSKKTG